MRSLKPEDEIIKKARASMCSCSCKGSGKEKFENREKMEKSNDAVNSPKHNEDNNKEKDLEKTKDKQTNNDKDEKPVNNEMNMTVL